MGAKKGKGKGGKKKPDPGWAKTIQYGSWSRPFGSLPPIGVRAAFTKIRVDFLAAVQEHDCIWSPTLTSDFLDELFSIPRPDLSQVFFLHCPMLKNFTRSQLHVPLKPKAIHPFLLDFVKVEG